MYFRLAFFLMCLTPLSGFCQISPDWKNWTLTLTAYNRGEEDPIEITGNPNSLLEISQVLKTQVKDKPQDLQYVITLKIDQTDIVVDDTLSVKKIGSFFKRHFLIINTCESYNLNPPVWITPLLNNEKVESNIDRKSYIQGKASFSIKGADENGDGYVTSLVKNFKDTYYQSYDDPIKSVAEKTWFFMYIQGFGDAASAFNLLIKQNHPFMDNNRDESTYFATRTILSFSGWETLAIRYDKMKQVIPGTVWTDEKVGTEGSASHDPKDLISAQYTLESQTQNKEVSINLDCLLLIFDY